MVGDLDVAVLLEADRCREVWAPGRHRLVSMSSTQMQVAPSPLLIGVEACRRQALCGAGGRPSYPAIILCQ